MDDCPRYRIVTEPRFDRIVRKLKRKDKTLFTELDRGVEKVLKNPELGKPLRYSLRNLRRIHVEGSFVLLYDVHACTVRLIDFDHHDKIYEKYA